MSEWTKPPIHELLSGQWPGEWGTDPTASDPGVRVYRSTELDDDGHVHEGIVRRAIPAGKLAAKKLQIGDTLLEASGGTPGRPVGRVGFYNPGHPEVAMCANFLRVLRPKAGICGSYLRWALLLFHRRPEIWRYQQQTTGMSNLNVRGYLGHRIDVAPKQEQPHIAEILSTVDEAIEQTEALIAKTQQIKAGLMHDLFTRGVTPDGQLRPSRDEAPHLYQESPLGWIPKEWEACPVEQLLDRIIDYRGKTPTKTDSGVPLITAKNVRMGFIDPEPREFIAESYYSAWMTRGIPRSSDILFTTEAPLGNVAQVGTADKVAFAQRVIILQPRAGVRPLFLRYRLMAKDFQIGAARLASGTTALGIKQSEFRKVVTSIPVNEDEQEAIERTLFGLDLREQGEWETMSKLKSEKAGLMHDLLTGHVRVPVPAERTKAGR